MITTQSELIAYFKEKLPNQPELIKFISIPEAEQDAALLANVNQALEAEGLAPIERILTAEEAEASYQEMMRPKHKFLDRLRRAWAILWAQDH